MSKFYDSATAQKWLEEGLKEGGPRRFVIDEDGDAYVSDGGNTR